VSKKIIQESISKITESNQWKQYLDFFSLYVSRYSIQNSVLLFSQFPEATYVAGRKQWLEKSRVVKEDAKPIILIAPEFEWFDVDINGEKKKGKRVVGYKEIEVFDITQTEPLNSIPTATISLSDTKFFQENAEIILELLKSHFNIVECEMKKEPELDAFISYADDKIFLNKDRSTLIKVKATLHELGHKYLHDGVILERALREVEAETFAYIVLKHLGLDVAMISAEYIAKWSQTIEVDRLVLRLAEMETAIKKLLRTIERL
jgi:hypothetical protein